MIIGFSGKMGVGKTTTCNYLLSMLAPNGINGLVYPRTCIVSFAGAMKQQAAEIYGFPLEWAYSKKDALVTIDKSRVAKEFIKSGWESGQVPVREILQYFATDITRNKSPDYWVAELDKNINRLKKPEKGGHRLFLVDDVRFPNELAYISQHGVCYRIEPYIGYKYNTNPHISETALDGAIFDDRFKPRYGRLSNLAALIFDRVRFLYGR